MMDIEDVVPLVREQFEMLNVIESTDDSDMAREFVLAATTLAKQMMETTQDAVHNARTVCGYHLPSSFEDLQDEDAKNLIQQGQFYDISKRLINAFRSNELPLPEVTVERRLDAFLDFGGQEPKPIVEDNETGGQAYSYPNAYKIFMKTIAKETGVKGRNLFHPVRLALTGEMSGQDVTKQMTLLSMASSEESPLIKNEHNEVVPLKERMDQLEAFLETIPEEYRVPQQSKKDKKEKATDGGEANQQSQGGESASASESVEGLRASYDGPPITALDIRVGVIRKVWEHEEADKLFCEEIDVGEDEPRMIASGLKPFFKAEELQDRKVLVLCNLKARKLVGFASHGMVLCASNEDHTDVKIVCPPVDAKIGERVTVPGWTFEGEEAAPFAENKVGKKKVFEKIAPFLKTSEYGVPEFLGAPLMTSAGVCTSPLPGAQVS
jgi:aminoacyl tRNA synthase complex-interacting multifunctional protein 1